MTLHPAARPDLEGARAFLDASPSPFHAVETAAAALESAGFDELSPADAWVPVEHGFCRRGGSLIAWRTADSPAGAGFRIVGAHTDSPGLRVKPAPDGGGVNFHQLGVEVYGGALLNSWLDRDLGVAGRVVLRDGTEVLLRIDDPIARVPQLAIHLDREVNERGLVLDKQAHLTPVWGTGPGAGPFASFVAARLDVAAAELAAWELQLYDVTPSAVLGADRSMLASGRLDNLASCWAGLAALLAGPIGGAGQTTVLALFDHEEVGSASTTGAAGPMLEHVLDRLVLSAGGQPDDRYRAFAASSCVSADNAHAVHPNYPERHEPGHRPIVNQGPVLKVNSNQRYATSAPTAARFQRACERAGVPMQIFVSRNTMPCGSTIGPITATRLGIETVDVGIPQLSMHSARELCGVTDLVSMTAALAAYFTE